jgi:hypothetical protein
MKPATASRTKIGATTQLWSIDIEDGSKERVDKFHSKDLANS